MGSAGRGCACSGEAHGGSSGHHQSPTQTIVVPGGRVCYDPTRAYYRGPLRKYMHMAPTRNPYDNSVYKPPMVPGYTGHVPYAAGLFGQRYAAETNKGIVDFERDQHQRAVEKAHGRQSLGPQAAYEDSVNKRANSHQIDYTKTNFNSNSQKEQKLCDCEGGKKGHGGPPTYYPNFGERYLKEQGMVPRYAGHVPGQQKQFGKTYGKETKNAKKYLGNENTATCPTYYTRQAQSKKCPAFRGPPNPSIEIQPVRPCPVYDFKEEVSPPINKAMEYSSCPGYKAQEVSPCPNYEEVPNCPAYDGVPLKQSSPCPVYPLEPCDVFDIGEGRPCPIAQPCDTNQHFEETTLPCPTRLPSHEYACPGLDRSWPKPCPAGK